MNSRHDAGRSPGLAAMARRMAKSVRSDRCGARALGAANSFFDLRIQQSRGLVPANGTCPVTSMYRVAPREYTSHRTSAFLALRNCSGAMKCGVPRPFPVRVRFSSPSTSLTSPRSVSRATRSAVSRMLSGFTSR